MEDPRQSGKVPALQGDAELDRTRERLAILLPLQQTRIIRRTLLRFKAYLQKDVRGRQLRGLEICKDCSGIEPRRCGKSCRGEVLAAREQPYIDMVKLERTNQTQRLGPLQKRKGEIGSDKLHHRKTPSQGRTQQHICLLESRLPIAAIATEPGATSHHVPGDPSGCTQPR